MNEKNNFYNQEYFQRRDNLPLHLAKTIELVLKDLGVQKILDVGCGTGKLVEFLNNTGFNAVGCDNSPWAVKISGQTKASATHLPFKSYSFDCVTAIGLIEHLSPKEANKFFEETRRVLKPKGYFFIATPNSSSIRRFLKGKKWFAYSDPTHIVFYSPNSLKKILEKHQFGNFRLTFKTNLGVAADWKPSFTSLPKVIQFMFNLILISSPLICLRDSFWILCQKRSYMPFNSTCAFQPGGLNTFKPTTTSTKAYQKDRL